MTTPDPLLAKLDEILERHLKHILPESVTRNDLRRELRAWGAEVAIDEWRRSWLAEYGKEPDVRVLDVMREQRQERFGVGAEEKAP